MLATMRIGASALLAQSLKLEVLAHNLANVQSLAFKSRRVLFGDLGYPEAVRLGHPVYAGRIGSGVAVQSVDPNFSPGALVETGRPLDWAIKGKGFLAVELPDGRWAYTRDGHLVVSTERRVAHAGSGYPLVGEITVPEEATSVAVTPDGRVTARFENGASEEIGQIRLYAFPNPGGLVAYGKNLWVASGLSGEPVEGLPASDGLGELLSGMLEASNVDVAEQMVELLLAQRAYQMGARSIHTAEEMWALANDLRR
jgi:flagellar basal-body rod protein FlgG